MMNRGKVQAEIKNILSTIKQPSRKQYRVAKYQLRTLEELGILDLMPAGFGYTDAARVIEAAQDAGGTKGAMNAFGEGESWIQDASDLYKALHEEEESVEIEVVENSNFDEMKVYSKSIRVGGEQLRHTLRVKDGVVVEEALWKPLGDFRPLTQPYLLLGLTEETVKEKGFKLQYE